MVHPIHRGATLRTAIVAVAVMIVVTVTVSPWGVPSAGAASNQSYRPIPAGWRLLDAERGDVFPGGGTEMVLLLGRKCRGVRKCFAYQTVVTQGSSRRKVAEIQTSIDEPVAVGTPDGSVRVSGYEGEAGYYEVWTYKSGSYEVTEAGGTS